MMEQLKRKENIYICKLTQILFAGDRSLSADSVLATTGWGKYCDGTHLRKRFSVALPCAEQQVLFLPLIGILLSLFKFAS